MATPGPLHFCRCCNVERELQRSSPASMVFHLGIGIQHAEALGKDGKVQFTFVCLKASLACLSGQTRLSGLEWPDVCFSTLQT